MFMIMDWLLCRLFFTALLLAASAIDGARADAIVTGTVFCDQCKDGKISLFDYPLYGIKVAVSCADSNGEQTIWREDTTNWFGNFVMRFDGTPDLTGCHAQVTGGGSGGGCTAVSGVARNVRLMFRLFDMEMYTVDPLLSEPAQPMWYCPRSAFPVPVTTPATSPPPVRTPSPVPQLPPVPPLPQLPPVPPLPQLPPVPPLPPMPPFPIFQASACPHWKWTMPEYKCYWKAVSPDSKVAVIFGLVAARRYGTDMTLWEAMQGCGDPYRTLLREATTSLLNSYTSVRFPYDPLRVIVDTNWALLGSTRRVLLTALQFRRANSGNGRIACGFTPCK